MIVVFDTSVIASAIFWHTSTAGKCLVALARRRFELVVTDEVANEYALTCAAMRARRPHQNPAGSFGLDFEPRNASYSRAAW